MKDPVLILGGRSDIGMAIAHGFAAGGHAIQLAARDAGTLEKAAGDITLRHGVAVSLHDFDVLETDDFSGFVAALPALPGVAVMAVGTMGDQTTQENDPAAARRDMRSNYEGPALALGAIANAFAARGSGVIVGISSVAGDRGRATNYIYGSAKAGFTAFLSGLRNRLAKQGVHVVTVKPGFVATRMTAGLDLPEKLTATPDEVATAVVTATEKRRNVIYVKPVWRLIMTIICAIPEGVFKRLKI